VVTNVYVVGILLLYCDKYMQFKKELQNGMSQSYKQRYQMEVIKMTDEQTDKDKGANRGIITGSLVGALTFAMVSLGLRCATGSQIADRSRVIPCIEQVQQGYIAPSKLEIQCKDLDGNGKPETIMKIGDKSYLLREVNGKPVISAYTIKSAEIQYAPAEIQYNK
jgi:hypothetical protein